MKILSSHATRFKAFASVLRSDVIAEDSEFVVWAIEELAMIDTEESREKIADYIVQLQQTGEVHPQYRLLSRLFGHLRELGWTDETFKDRGVKPMYWG